MLYRKIIRILRLPNERRYINLTLKLTTWRGKFMKKKLAYLIATFFGAGYAPAAPGTAGSLVTLPFAAVLAYYFGLAGILIATAIVFVIGTCATHEVLKTSKHDPSFVVIDEVAGQLLSFALIADNLQFDGDSWLLYLLGFMLFRLFDITKPQPAGWADRKVRNAFGVMLDDIFAGAYAAIVLYLFNLWMNS